LLHDYLLARLALLPKIKGVTQRLLEPFNDHGLQILVYHDGLASLHRLPLVEVLGNLAVDHGFDGVEATISA